MDTVDCNCTWVIPTTAPFDRLARYMTVLPCAIQGHNEDRIYLLARDYTPATHAATTSQTERGYPPLIEAALSAIKNANIVGVTGEYESGLGRSLLAHYTFTVEH